MLYEKFLQRKTVSPEILCNDRSKLTIIYAKMFDAFISNRQLLKFA